mmetsp:Transcript_112134/g.328072  ORF Transcript_112134/g.328072 Transcript_112134/m.328072 type:complete len:205 (+) Transcript_112134:1118-1732(+)
MLRRRRAVLRKVGLHARHRAEIHGVPGLQQEQLVELREESIGGLVDRAEHRDATARQVLEDAHHVGGSSGVQAAGWLVTQEELRQAAHDGEAHAQAPALAAGDALEAEALVAYGRGGAGAELEAGDDRVHSLFPVPCAGLGGESELCGVEKHLARREGAQVDVFLRHHAGHQPHHIGVHAPPVAQQLALDLRPRRREPAKQRQQ